MSILKTKTRLAGFHGTVERQGLREKIGFSRISLFLLLYPLWSRFYFSRFAPQQDIPILSFRGQICEPVSLPLRRLPPCALSMDGSSSHVSSSLNLTSAALNGLSLNGAPCGCSKSSSDFKNKKKSKKNKKLPLRLWSIYLPADPSWTSGRGRLFKIQNCKLASSPSLPAEISTVVSGKQCVILG